jgi:hypothetical protein
MTDDTARDEFPELATNEEWRVAMRQARDGRKMSQEELQSRAVAMAPDLLRGSQGVISRIESGKIQSSRLVVPICRILDIQLPSHYVDDQEREWVEMWRRYREKAPARAAAALAFLKAQLEETDK